MSVGVEMGRESWTLDLVEKSGCGGWKEGGKTRGMLGLPCEPLSLAPASLPSFTYLSPSETSKGVWLLIWLLVHLLASLGCQFFSCKTGTGEVKRKRLSATSWSCVSPCPWLAFSPR